MKGLKMVGKAMAATAAVATVAMMVASAPDVARYARIRKM